MVFIINFIIKVLEDYPDRQLLISGELNYSIYILPTTEVLIKGRNGMVY